MSNIPKGKKAVLVYIPEKLVRDIKIMSAYKKLRVSSYVVEALQDKLEKDIPELRKMK